MRIAARPAAKVTPDRINALIVGESYHRLTATLTMAVLTLTNGFTVTGESACASPENYDQAIGEQIARKNAGRPNNDLSLPRADSSARAAL